MTEGAAGEAARVARDGRGRLLAILSRRTRDMAAAEDALQGAFLKALDRWPSDGIPQEPEAWLLTAARNSLTDGGRRAASADRGEETVRLLMDELAEGAGQERLPDRRLELLFVCAHPAIAEDLRAPLMLNVVLGAPAKDIARCWLTRPEAMAQRLVRAKAKIKTARIPFDIPSPQDREARLGPVLDAVYAALTLGGTDGAMLDEAVYLTGLLSQLLPHEPEAAGLRALGLQHAAIRQKPGEPFVPLAERDPAAFDHRALEASETLLRKAARKGLPGRYQLEAAIGSAHLAKLREGLDTRAAIIGLYEKLLGIAPSLGATCGYAAALMETGRTADAEAVLDGVAEEASSYQPFWVVKARLAETLGQSAKGASARQRALDLTVDPRQQGFLKG